VIDAKSGVSGAGRGVADEMQVVKDNDDSRAYKVGGHRHAPEIAQELGGASLTFVPHLLPFDDGELASCYVRTTRETDADEIASLYEVAYAEEPFVEVTDEPPGAADVRGTNLCRIHVVADPDSGRVMAFAAIDNLWKGASSQAVQNLNLMLGLPEGTGIEDEAT
jgi:N-acetyl-gamma-glutamyl-phosphate reductase